MFKIVIRYKTKIMNRANKNMKYSDNQNLNDNVDAEEYDSEK
jgi:hypothetical protein